jgi:hypothetical protein
MREWYLGLLGVLLAGCGGGTEGPPVYQLQGQVKFNGEPVPYGRVEFVPDTAKGNSGGSGYADIVDGKYDTALPSGRGVIGGPHLVTFTGQSAKPAVTANAEGTIDETAASDAAPIPLLFSEYREEHDLPKEDSVLNFDLPPEAAFTLKAGAADANRPANEP